MREVGVDVDVVAFGPLDGERNNNRHIDTVDVDEVLLGGINGGLVGVGSLELNWAVADFLGEQSERLEDLELDLVDVGARARDNELLESGENEVAGDIGEEGLSAGALALGTAIEAVLLSFLADYRCNGADDAGDVSATVGHSVLLDILENSEGDVGEGLRQSDSITEVVDGELELASLDRVLLEVLQQAIDVERVELLLLK